MPKRYVDLDEALKLFDADTNYYDGDGNVKGRLTHLEALQKTVKKKLSSLPFADVVERKKGKWVKLYSDTFHCRLCGSTFIVLQGKDSMNYCPSCGVDMRGEHDAETN